MSLSENALEGKGEVGEGELQRVEGKHRICIYDDDPRGRIITRHSIVLA